MENVTFRWLVDPPSEIDGERVKYNDVRRYSRERAERWAEIGYGYVIPDTEPEPEMPTAEDESEDDEGDDAMLFIGGCKEHFVWTDDAPALGIKAGERQLIPRDISRAQAQRWAAAGHGRIERIEKPQRRVAFTVRRDHQQLFGVMNIKAGQTIYDIPEREARRLELAGEGSIGTVLKPFVRDDNKLQEFMREEAELLHDNQRPAAVVVDFDRRTGKRRYAPGGWMAAAGMWG